MKKRITTILVVIVAVCLLMAACTDDRPNIQKVSELVSNKQTMMMIGTDENFGVMVSQMHEEDVFVADGLVGKQTTNTTLAVKPLKANLLSKQYTYTLVGEKGNLSGELVKDNLGVTFKSKLENIESIGTIKQVVVKYDDKEVTIDLADKMVGLDWQKVLKIAYETYQDKIDEAMGSKEGLGREVYIKMLSDKATLGGECYWYVSFIASRDDYWAVLIDTNGSVVNKREYCVKS